MKKSKKTALTAALFAATITMTGCGLYGPPNSEELQAMHGLQPTEAPTEAPATFRPEDEEPQDVYGPPPGEEDPVDETEEETFRPEDEEPQDVYGPPPCEEDPVDETEEETFMPGNETPVPVYGPPEGFE